jgi:hypothetical protein
VNPLFLGPLTAALLGSEDPTHLTHFQDLLALSRSSSTFDPVPFRKPSGSASIQPSDDGPRELSVSQTHEQGTDAHTYLEARMLAALGMLLAVSRILWIIIVVVVVLVLLGFFARGR